jgi:hypothetical protein
MFQTTMRPTHGFIQVWLGVVLVLLSMSTPVLAGVDLGPVPKDKNEAEDRRIMQAYEAQKSYEEKLRVGKERTLKRETNRVRMVAAMTSELVEREKTVSIPMETTTRGASQSADTWSGTALGVLAVGIGFLAFRFYLKRQEESS